jgi:hypothetical protein
LSGTIQAGQIAFVSKVDPPPSNQGPRFPGVVAARQQRDEGLFSAFVRERFTVKRGVAAFPGRVTVEDGAPCPVFRLIFVNSNGKRLEAIRRDLRPTVIARPVPTMRQFLARLPAGKYRVEVADLPKGFVAASIQAAGADILRTGLEVPADGIPTALTVTIGITGGPPWTALQGRVVNTATRKGQMRSGNVSVAPRLLPPTGLQLTSSAFFEPWLLDLGPNGSFEFPRIPAGQYQVHVLPDTVNTPALKLQIPAAGLVNLEIAAPDVVPIGCGNC